MPTSGFTLRALSLLRNVFKIPTGRNVIVTGKYVIKIYNNIDECVYEHHVLSEIARFNTAVLEVPRVIKPVVTGSHCALIMTRISAQSLDKYILDFAMRGCHDAIKVFYMLGRSVRELHGLEIKYLRNSGLMVCNTPQCLRREVVRLTKELIALGMATEDLLDAILNVAERVPISDDIFAPVSLHGELYITHVMVCDKKICLLDFHEARKGPAYLDLATFNISLYSSLALPPQFLRRLTLLTEAFLRGYRDSLSTEFIASAKLAELYLILAGVRSALTRPMYATTPAIRALTILKAKRLMTAASKVILPALFSIARWGFSA